METHRNFAENRPVLHMNTAGATQYITSRPNTAKHSIRCPITRLNKLNPQIRCRGLLVLWLQWLRTRTTGTYRLVQLGSLRTLPRLLRAVSNFMGQRKGQSDVRAKTASEWTQMSTANFGIVVIGRLYLWYVLKCEIIVCW